LANIKEIKRLRGGDLQVAAQANVQIDAEIGQKNHFRIGNLVLPRNHFRMDLTHSVRFYPFLKLREAGEAVAVSAAALRHDPDLGAESFFEHALLFSRKLKRPLRPPVLQAKRLISSRRYQHL